MNQQLWESLVLEKPGPRTPCWRSHSGRSSSGDHVISKGRDLLRTRSVILWSVFSRFGPPLLTFICSLCGLGEGAPGVGHKDIRGVKTLPLELPSEIDPVIYLQGWLMRGGGGLVTMV